MEKNGTIPMRVGLASGERVNRSNTGPGWRALAGRALAALAVCTLALSSAVATASAKVTHEVLATIHGADAPGGPLGPFLVSDAVDETTGNVYVLESNLFGFGVGVVDEFAPNGEYAGVQLTGSQTPQGTFGFGVASGVAVDNSLGLTSRDVYVADTEHGVVDRFDSTGAFVCQITARAPSSAEEIEHDCNGASGSETPNNGFSPAGVAIDATGDIYVVDAAHEVVDEFGPGGQFLKELSSSELQEQLRAVAVGANGHIYVTNAGSSVVEFDATGGFVGVLDARVTTSVGASPAAGNVFTGESEGTPAIGEYGTAGEEIGTFGQGVVGTVAGLAVNGTNGRVFASELQFCEGCGTIIEFGPDLVVPDLGIKPATGVTETSAVLHGDVDPDTAHGGGEVTGCEFEVVTQKAFEEHSESPFEGATVVPCVPATTTVPTEVAASFSATPGTMYRYRLTVHNADGADQSKDAGFTTLGAPSITGQLATAHAVNAIVHAKINPLGFATTCEVQYVSASGFAAGAYAGAKTVPCSAVVGEDLSPHEATARLSGLSVSTTYHYRFVARNQAGTVVGEDATFETFGITEFSFATLDGHGEPFTQAGGHPYRLLTSFELATSSTVAGTQAADANLRDVHIELPPGLVGNPSATSKCTREALTNFECGGSTQVGVLHVREARGTQFEVGIYNLVPPAGVPAEFGAKINSVVNAYIDASVRTGGDYGVNTDVRGISTGVGIVGATAEFWGVPADPTHNEDRFCPVPGGRTLEVNPCSSVGEPIPFLTNPTKCSGPQQVKISADSWQGIGEFVSETATLPGTTGCDRLHFTPSVTVQPDSTMADSPSGLSFDLRLPQDQNPTGLAESTLAGTVVRLPSGFSVSPSAANGLQACSPAQISLNSDIAPTCPDASRIGLVEITTPLLADRLRGSVFVATQGDNPFSSLLAIYIAAEADGVLIKLAGHVEADGESGQLTTTVESSPPLPFSELRLRLFGGPRAALATPEGCGAYTAAIMLSPWSGLAPALLSEQIQIGSACVSGFSPTASAGTVVSRAGRYSPLVTSFARADNEHEFRGLTVSLPAGLSAKLAGVPLCADSNAGAGTCPDASQIGTVQTGAGPGSTPIFLPGRVYLTGPYRGAPYGLSVVVPAVAGPFNLGTVVVRQALQVDPNDAHVTVVSDPFPTILRGIPIRLKSVAVSIDRPNFIFNPTGCSATALALSFVSTGGARSTATSPFQIGECSALPFKPSFAASTVGPGTKADGVSFEVKVQAPGQGPRAVADAPPEANIKRVDVQLPKQLPSRLTTLQKACTERQFAKDPAGCPPESRVGSAVALTPILADPLTGPAYLVSHGNQAFPDLVIVLQADGITVDLAGHTQIKNGITFSHFETVPDEPISSFDLKLPAGNYSVLTTNANICPRPKPVRVRRTVTVHGRKKVVTRRVMRRATPRLVMPTTITGQNGAVVKQSTKVSVAGCSAVHRATPKRAKRVSRPSRARPSRK